MNFSVDIIWAKNKYGKFWPARLSTPPKNLQTPKKCVYVCYFGSDNYEFVQLENVKSYLKHRSAFASLCNGNDFKEAVRLCDETCSKQSDTSHEISIVKEDRDMICQKCTEKDSRIKNLLNENEELKIKIANLENNNKSIKCRKQRISKKEYEVGRILDDKIVNGKKEFLVHWKNFGPKHDTWVNEDDLNCPNILQGYLSAKSKRRK